MIIALRGEGPTDIGKMDSTTFIKGPMVHLIEGLACFHALIEDCFGGTNVVNWLLIDKRRVNKSQERRRKAVIRAAKDSNMKTKVFFRNAESFANLAKEGNADVAIFFVDCDKDDYDKRYSSVKEGLKAGGYDCRGVPMIPKKISEAWLLCCNEPRDCKKYETLPTGDESNLNHPKKLLRNKGKTPLAVSEECNPNRIDMPSFNRFREDFRKAVNDYCSRDICQE